MQSDMLGGRMMPPPPPQAGPPAGAPADTDGSGPGEVRFTPPEGFQKPASDSNEFDLVCTFRAEQDGSLVLTKLGETDMPGGEEEEAEPQPQSKPDYSDYTGPMIAAGQQ